MLKQSEKHEGFNNHPNRRMAKGPQLPWAIKKVGDVPMDLPKGRPVVIGDTYEMPLPEKADALYILGNVLMPWGYPQNGKKGDEVGKYIVTYTDGTTQEITLRNGVEVTTASVLAGQSRINPIAQKAEQAIYFTYDKNWEHYVVHMYCLPLEEGKHPQSLTVKCQKEGSSLLLFGVSAYQK